jgi:NTP pyrophosphatase (non-canonical NTP hydrolase)
MNLLDYQKKALMTSRAADAPNEMYHRVLGLVGESGEIAEKFKKLVRDHDGDLSALDTDDMKQELGDVLWYVATLADYLDLSLEDIAQTNIAKLKDRLSRNAIKGSGDNR